MLYVYVYGYVSSPPTSPTPLATACACLVAAQQQLCVYPIGIFQWSTLCHDFPGTQPGPAAGHEQPFPFPHYPGDLSTTWHLPTCHHRCTQWHAAGSVDMYVVDGPTHKHCTRHTQCAHTDYLDQQYNGTDIGILRQYGTAQVFFFDVLDNGNRIQFNAAVPVVNFRTDVNNFTGRSTCGGWRPHGMVFRAPPAPAPAPAPTPAVAPAPAPAPATAIAG